ncbi:MAG: metallophosphoesterase [Oscillospiraceae bacterium]|nr:metallophosphoesterase [Oscillospiraceae bacterium]
MTIRYLSDLHLDHGRLIDVDKRPFASLEEMNEALIQNWNRVVQPEDLTYILGDFCYGDGMRWRELLSRLEGRKVLIRGNHDAPASVEAARDLLEAVDDYMEIRDRDRKVVLCHYPIVCYRDLLLGSVHLYGHVHAAYDWELVKEARQRLRDHYGRADICRMANVGAMLPYMDYTPRTLDELMPQL